MSDDRYFGYAPEQWTAFVDAGCDAAALELLAAFPSYDHTLLRQATITDANDALNPLPQDLLLEAAMVEP